MHCKVCNGEITEHQSKEYNGCCCGVCETKVLKNRLQCFNCGLLLSEDEIKRYGEYCSGGCAGEYLERME